MSDLGTLIAQYPALCRDTPRGRVDFVGPEGLGEPITSAYAVPYLEDGRCLVVRRRDGNFTIPGGTLEPGESWPDALIRELREETGARVDRHELVGAYRIERDETTTFRVFCWAEVSIVSKPAEPESGPASIAEVRTCSPAGTSALFGGDFAHLGSVYALVDAVYQSPV